MLSEKTKLYIGSSKHGFVLTEINGGELLTLADKSLRPMQMSLGEAHAVLLTLPGAADSI